MIHRTLVSAILSIKSTQIRMMMLAFTLVDPPHNPAAALLCAQTPFFMIIGGNGLTHTHLHVIIDMVHSGGLRGWGIPIAA